MEEQISNSIYSIGNLRRSVAIPSRIKAWVRLVESPDEYRCQL